MPFDPPPAPPPIRISPGKDGVSVWSAALFGADAGTQIRKFLVRVFSVAEVAAVEIRRADMFGRVRYTKTDDAAAIWLKLSRALRGEGDAAAVWDADDLCLDLPGSIRIFRVGGALTTWQPRFLGAQKIRLSQGLLRNNKDMAYRLEDELTTIPGVISCGTNIVAATVSIRFYTNTITSEQLIRELELATARALRGKQTAQSAKKLATAGGLLGLAATADYLVPPLKPLSLLGCALYGLPNVIGSAKELRHWHVGLPALYSVRLGMMLWTGLTFNSAAFAVLTQLWPRWSFETMTRSHRLLFARQRRRAISVRALRDGTAIETSIGAVKIGDLILASQGEILPADGIVVRGQARLDEEALSGGTGALEKAIGDEVFANSLVLDGALTIRVTRSGGDTVAGQIMAWLPGAHIGDLPSSAAAEHIANRNARPALAIAGLHLLLRRSLRPAQAILRPDYATAPRLSAQLAALHGLAQALTEGILFRHPAALERLHEAEVFVIDDSANLGAQQAETADILARITARHRQIRFVYISKNGQAAAADLAAQAGITAAFGGLDQAGKVEVMKKFGPRAVWIGDGAAPDARPYLAACFVSVSVAGMTVLAHDKADAVLLQGGLQSLPALADLAARHQALLAADYRIVYALNLFAAAAGIFGGFGGREAGAVSNAGTGIIYATHWARLRRLISRNEKTRAARLARFRDTPRATAPLLLAPAAR